MSSNERIDLGPFYRPIPRSCPNITVGWNGAKETAAYKRSNYADPPADHRAYYCVYSVEGFNTLTAINLPYPEYDIDEIIYLSEDDFFDYKFSGKVSPKLLSYSVAKRTLRENPESTTLSKQPEAQQLNFAKRKIKKASAPALHFASVSTLSTSVYETTSDIVPYHNEFVSINQ